jgi:hypothetical protein
MLKIPCSLEYQPGDLEGRVYTLQYTNIAERVNFGSGPSGLGKTYD